jgi:chromosome segregation ATPase
MSFDEVELERAERSLSNLESESAGLPIQLKSATQEANAARIHELRARAASIGVDLFSARALVLRLRIKSEEQRGERLREQRGESERVLTESARKVFAVKQSLDALIAEHGRLDFQHGLLENSYRLSRSEVYSMKQELDELIRSAGETKAA